MEGGESVIFGLEVEPVLDGFEVGCFFDFLDEYGCQFEVVLEGDLVEEGIASFVD